MKRLFLIPVVLLIHSCKTQEEIKREQYIDNQLKAQQSLLAGHVTKMQAMEERLAAMTGKMDQVQYDNQQTYGQKISELAGRVDLLEEAQTTMQEEIEEQGNYVKKVISTLDKMTGTGGKPKDAYGQAMGNYKRGRYKRAKNQLLDLLGGNKVKGSRRARVLHNLGMIAYMDEDDKQALVYFSKLFTDYPKSSYNKNGLLVLAKVLRRMDQPPEGKGDPEGAYLEISQSQTEGRSPKAVTRDLINRKF